MKVPVLKDWSMIQSNAQRWKCWGGIDNKHYNGIHDFIIVNWWIIIQLIE